MPDQLPLPSPDIPPRPRCRPTPSRVGTLCFWVALVLFIIALILIWRLAISHNPSRWNARLGSGGDVALALLGNGSEHIHFIG